MNSDFIIPSQRQLEKFKEIRLKLSKLQDWGVVESLKRMGIEHKNTLGVSYVSIKNLAEKYEYDHILAKMLWRLGRREEQIFASFILPYDVAIDDVYKLLDTAISFEVAEYFGAIFLSKYEHILEIATNELEKHSKYVQTAVIVGIAKHRMLFTSTSIISDNLFKCILSKKYTDTYVEMIKKRYSNS